MSWEIYIQDFPNDIESLSEVPENFEPKSIGKSEHLKTLIKERFDVIDDKGCLSVEKENEWSIDVRIGEQEDCKSIMIEVRGNTVEAVETLRGILLTLNYRAVDMMTGEFVDQELLEKSAKDFKRYVSQIIRGS